FLLKIFRFQSLDQFFQALTDPAGNKFPVGVIKVPLGNIFLQVIGVKDHGTSQEGKLKAGGGIIGDQHVRYKEEVVDLPFKGQIKENVFHFPGNKQPFRYEWVDLDDKDRVFLLAQVVY